MSALGERYHQQNLLDIQQEIERRRTMAETLMKLASDPSTRPEHAEEFMRQHSVIINTPYHAKLPKDIGNVGIKLPLKQGQSLAQPPNIPPPGTGMQTEQQIPGPGGEGSISATASMPPSLPVNAPPPPDISAGYKMSPGEIGQRQAMQAEPGLEQAARIRETESQQESERSLQGQLKLYREKKKLEAQEVEEFAKKSPEEQRAWSVFHGHLAGALPVSGLIPGTALMAEGVRSDPATGTPVKKESIYHVVRDKMSNKVAAIYEGVQKEDSPAEKEYQDWVNNQPKGAKTDRWTYAQAKARIGPSARIAIEGNPRSMAQLEGSYKYNNNVLDKVAQPIELLVNRLGRLNDTIAQNTPAADALVAPELLTVMAGGQGSGLRMNEAEIARIVGGRTHWEDLKAAINKWKTESDHHQTVSITSAQRLQIRSLVETVNKKIQAKQKVLDDARQGLSEAESPAEHKKIVTNARHAITGIDQGNLAVDAPPPLPKGDGKILDDATARQFYEAAGRDPNKARSLATQNGWKIAPLDTNSTSKQRKTP